MTKKSLKHMIETTELHLTLGSSHLKYKRRQCTLTCRTQRLTFNSKSTTIQKIYIHNLFISTTHIFPAKSMGIPCIDACCVFTRDVCMYLLKRYFLDASNHNTLIFSITAFYSRGSCLNRLLNDQQRSAHVEFAFFERGMFSRLMTS